jgi:hypothetical protein
MPFTKKAPTEEAKKIPYVPSTRAKEALRLRGEPASEGRVLPFPFSKFLIKFQRKLRIGAGNIFSEYSMLIVLDTCIKERLSS